MNAGRGPSIINEIYKVTALQEELEGTIADKRISNTGRNANARFNEFAETLYLETRTMLERRRVDLDAHLAYIHSPEGNAPPDLEHFDYEKVAENILTLSAISRLRSDEITLERFSRAIYDGDVGMVSLLIHLGIDPSAERNFAIQVASERGHQAVVNWLLADPRVDPSAGENYPIRWASKNGHVAVVDRLLQYRDASGRLCVDPSAEDNLAIRWASRNGHVAVVDRLLADPRVNPSADGNFAIRVASENGRLAVVERLLADPRVYPSARNNEAIRLASNRGHLAVVNRLLEDPRVDPSARNNEAIQFASQFGHAAVVARLLEDPRVDPTAIGLPPRAAGGRRRKTRKTRKTRRRSMRRNHGGKRRGW